MNTAARTSPLDPRRLAGPVWVVSPHPDDEALGCGALIAALGSLGREVHALLLTDGGFSHPHSRLFPRDRLARTRLAEWRTGLALLGVPATRTHALGLPDGALAGVAPAELQRRVARAFVAAPPGTLLLPWRRDPHPDHRAAWEPVTAAAPPAARQLEYAVWLPERGEAVDWPAADEARIWTFAVGAARGLKARAIAAHVTQLGGVSDDPDGFTLAPEMVKRAVAGPERYAEAAAAGLEVRA
ncbi:PIG-L domain-containing protein [Deinococcus aerolatus]|uniref:PIG-L domain-containing protein n=1 Tax=Deinococcus aerolatus TaxID=522487 RepID=A0ABQ2G808_9DEIO|nr:PIG-L deacetylase family protein [Deinococcus aerolatus]GGL79550.1 PIG-L domain-containing protein [Deinococcus aerolatus]